MKDKLNSLSQAFKPTKSKIILLVSLLTITGLFAGFVPPGGAPGRNKTESEAVRTVTLTRGDIASTVSATGTVYSTKATEIYSNLNYSVKTIHVAVGDKVNEGDVLCELDTTTLESDIAQKQASVWANQSSAQQNLASAQQDLQTYKNNLENNLDSNLINAESSVAAAETSLKNAELEVQNAELDVQAAGNDVYSAQRNLRDARNGEGAYEETGEATDYEQRTLRETIIAKQTTLDKATTNLEKAKSNLAKAEEELVKAKKSYNAARASANDTVVSYQNKVKSAQVSNNFNDQYINIEKLQGDLEKCVITAPVSGTITAVNIVEGGSGNGLLFMIQDTDNLKVVTNIKEYDIDTVTIGDKVIIKADATGNQEFSGKLSKIAPTSTQTNWGEASASTDAEFESEITVLPGAKGLRIGMNTRLSIVTAERKNIFSVPYEAVGTDSDKSTYVYVMKTNEDGSISYEKVLVTTGLETNLYVEISGKDLTEGMQVARSAQSVPAEAVAATPSAENSVEVNGDSQALADGGNGQ